MITVNSCSSQNEVKVLKSNAVPHFKLELMPILEQVVWAAWSDAVQPLAYPPIALSGRMCVKCRPVSLPSAARPSSPCLFLMWTFLLPDWEKVFPQIPHTWGFSPGRQGGVSKWCHLSLCRTRNIWRITRRNNCGLAHPSVRACASGDWNTRRRTARSHLPRTGKASHLKEKTTTTTKTHLWTHET